MKYNNINNNKGLFEGRKNLVFVVSLIIMFFSSFISVFAVSSYLYNSNEVSFNNSSSSSINSSNVQGAIDELYADAHNYEEMNTRVSTLESHFSGDPQITLSGGTSAYNIITTNVASGKDGGYSLNYNGKRRGYLFYDTASDKIFLEARTADGSMGSGTLDLRGNPVRINGNGIDGVQYVTGCSGNFSFANMTKCFKDKINSFPKNRPFLIQMNYSGQRYGMGYVYDGNAYANFTMVNFDGSTVNIRNNNGSWAYKETNNTSNYTGVS